jgi:hypothetical protein
LLWFPLNGIGQQQSKQKILKLAIIGLVHDHVNWIFNRDQQDVQVVGIVETDKEAIFKIPKALFVARCTFF